MKPFFPSAPVQPQLTIGQPGDRYEQEADAMGDHVARMSDTLRPTVQETCADCEEKEALRRQAIPGEEKRGEEPPVQAKREVSMEAGGRPSLSELRRAGEDEPPQAKPLMRKAEAGPSVTMPELTSRLNQSKGGGRALPANTQRFMGQAFDADFSGVRVHTDERAAEMNRGLQAKAFTHGGDIYFNRGQYQPDTTEGRRLLGHELTHVVQQSNDQPRPRSIKRQQIAPPQTTPPSCPSVSELLNVAKKRCEGEIGKAYDTGTEPGWWYSPNRKLKGARKKAKKWEIARGALNPLPAGNYIVNWGDQLFTCNLFVYDVLHEAGLAPPLNPEKHYYDAKQTYNLAGPLNEYFEEIKDHTLVCPGDIMANGTHLELLETGIDSSGSFTSYGGHLDGAYSTSRSAYASDKFLRVKGKK